MATHKIGLQPGQTYRVELGGLGSAGYLWEHRIEGEGTGEEGIVRIETEPSRVPPRPPPGGPPPDSYSVSQTAIVLALRPGKAVVRLVLRRPWERNKPPLRETVLEIDVAAS